MTSLTPCGRSRRRLSALQSIVATLALLACMTPATSLVAADIVVDNDGGAAGYVETGTWQLGSSTGYNGGTYRYAIADGNLATATWTPTLPAAATYEVYTVFRTGTNRPTVTPYTITHAGGTSVVNISQYGSPTSMKEVLLGSFPFNAGSGGTVQLANTGTADKAHIADAIIWRAPVDTPPSFGTLSTSPSYPMSTDMVTARAVITDDLGVTSASMVYTVLPSGTSGAAIAYDDGAHGDEAAGDSLFAATIPAQATGQTVTFRFTASDTIGQVGVSPTGSYTVGNVPQPEYRCLWADSWSASFLNESQAQDLVNTARANNINTIIIEVRKIGDAYYSSSIEPRATNISGGASFDPLGYVIQLAHDTSGGKKRLQVHAWFVVHRIAKAETLSSLHVLKQHPEYEMLKSDGSVDSSTRYVDPGHPGTVDWNIAVMLDCMSKYDIDGVNLDYIRYPESTGPWGYNAVSVQRFNTIYGKSGTPDSSDPDWCNWRRECVTLEVKKLYVKMWKMRPSTLLTACTVNWGSNYTNFPASSAYAGVFQDWVGWLRQGIMDYNAIMNYTSLTSPERFQGWTDLSLAEDGLRGSIIGIGAYLHSSVQGSMDQLLWARSRGAEGLNIYDWGSEVNANSLGETRTSFYSALKAQVYPNWVDPPQPAWKYSPTLGIVEGTVTGDGGSPVDHATVTVDGNPATQTVTDGSGWYGLLHLPVGPHSIRFYKAAVIDRVVSATITYGGQIVTLDIQAGQADVAVTKTASSATVLFPGNVTYSVNVTNNGPDSAPSVMAVDTLPPTVTVGALTPGMGSTEVVGNSIVWTLGTLASGQSATLTVVATPTGVGELVNGVSVSSGAQDTNGANNTATVSVSVLPPGVETLADDLFATDPTNPTPGATVGWTPFAPSTAGMEVDYDDASEALRVTIGSGTGDPRINGWVTANSEWLPYSSVGTGNFVRAKFHIFRAGQADMSDNNQVPNMRLRVATRFAVNSMLDVFNHLAGDPAGTLAGNDLTPSSDPTSPSVYRVDLDPVDVPALALAGEGISRGFEAYCLEDGENGSIELTESAIGVYPAVALPGTGPLIRAVRTFLPEAAEGNDLRVIDSSTDGPFLRKFLLLSPGVPGPEIGLDGATDPSYSESSEGITLDSTVVPSGRLALVVREFTAVGTQTERIRVDPGRQYQLRWHVTSDTNANTNPQLRLRARTLKFMWSQRLEIGSSLAAGNANNAIAQQALPGVGCANPDQLVPGEHGGWYSLLMATPMDPAIRSSQPYIESQPGPGEDAPSLRDIKFGVDLIDTLGAMPASKHEKGRFTIDRVELRAYDLVAD